MRKLLTRGLVDMLCKALTLYSPHLEKITEVLVRIWWLPMENRYDSSQTAPRGSLSVLLGPSLLRPMCKFRIRDLGLFRASKLQLRMSLLWQLHEF